MHARGRDSPSLISGSDLIKRQILNPNEQPSLTSASLPFDLRLYLRLQPNGQQPGSLLRCASQGNIPQVSFNHHHLVFMAQVFITALLVADFFLNSMHVPNGITLARKKGVRKMKDLPGQARQGKDRLMNDNEADFVWCLKSFK